MPWISSPNATLSITRRCASRPKCWKTIETVFRRSARSSAWLAPVTSWPAIEIEPALGSISRINVRTRVDLPDPDNPITTNTSPGQTSNETSRTAATQPVLARSSARESSASGLPTTRSAFGPNTFQMPSARISGSRLRSMRAFSRRATVSALAVTVIPAHRPADDDRCRPATQGQSTARIACSKPTM